MSSMLLSIKPIYAKAILEGKKEYEFRKRRCKPGVNKIVFYSTSPESKVVGEADYHGYYNAVAYKLTNVVAYVPPKKLSDYGIGHVPQSFIYLD